MTNMVHHFHSKARSWSIVSITVMSLTLLSFSNAATAHEGYGSLVEKLIPSVVSITVEAERTSNRPVDNFPPEFQDFLDRYFRDSIPQNQDRKRVVQSSGSGFFISEDGYIVTNAHVVENGTNIKVQLSDTQTFDAEVIGADPNTDIAVLKIDPGDQQMPVLPFGDSDDTRVGEHVLAIGNPLGLDFSVSAGIVSGRNRMISGGFDDFIQTDAAINSGNSGGPLLNLDGEVIGVNTLYLRNRQAGGGSSGIGFAMASAVVEGVVDQLIEFGTTRRGWLGIAMQPITSDIAEAIGLESPEGSLVVNLLEGPARDAGIKVGDVITEIDGQTVSNNRDLLRYIASAGTGTEVDVTIYRNGEPVIVTVTLASREEAEGNPLLVTPVNLEKDSKETEIFGMKLGELNDDMRSTLGVESEDGLIVLNVDKTSSAGKSGILEGDIILKVDSTNLTSIDGFSNAIATAEEEDREAVLLYVEREDNKRFVALPIED